MHELGLCLTHFTQVVVRTVPGRGGGGGGGRNANIIDCSKDADGTDGTIPEQSVSNSLLNLELCTTLFIVIMNTVLPLI